MLKRILNSTQSMMVTCLLITGLGIGWLVGLSVSPVVSIVITSVTGSAAAIVAALSGLEEKPEALEATNRGQPIRTRWSVNPLPLTILVIGILVGSAFGVRARNQSWLGSAVAGEITQWTRAGLTGPGWSPEEIARKLFESRYLASGVLTNTVTTSAPSISPVGGYLFAVDATECKRLLGAVDVARQGADDSVLRAELSSSTNQQLWQLPVIITDTTVLQNVVEQVLCTDGR